MPEQNSQTAQSAQIELRDLIDYNKLGVYAPENESEEELLDSALKSLEKAEEYKRKNQSQAKDPYKEARKRLEQRKQTFEETGQLIDSEARQKFGADGGISSNFYDDLRDRELELAESTLELYIELKKRKAEFENNSLSWVGTDNSDSDSEQDLLQQETARDLIDHFLNNPQRRIG